jgi:hypothetical protein
MSALSKQGAGKDILIHLLFIYCYGVLKWKLCNMHVFMGGKWCAKSKITLYLD